MCAPGAFQLSEYGCYELRQEKLNWVEAELFCNDLGGYLVVWETVMEYEAVKSYIATVTGISLNTIKFVFLSPITFLEFITL